MKQLIMISIAIIMLGCATTNPAIAGRIGDRQIKQQERILKGVNSGALTGEEARRLEKEQLLIKEAKEMALRDGILTDRERLKIEAMQDKASKRIYRLKHNENRR